MNINIAERICRARGGGMGDGAIVFKDSAIASKQLVKTYGLFFKVRNKGAIVQKGGNISIFFIIN